MSMSEASGPRRLLAGAGHPRVNFAVKSVHSAGMRARNIGFVAASVANARGASTRYTYTHAYTIKRAAPLDADRSDPSTSLTTVPWLGERRSRPSARVAALARLEPVRAARRQWPQDAR